MIIYFSENEYKVKADRMKFDFFSGIGFRWTGVEWSSPSPIACLSLYRDKRIFIELDKSAEMALRDAKKLFMDSRSEIPSSLILDATEGKEWLPYQLSGIEGLVERGNALLADEPGLGKTIQIAGLITVQNPDQVLIVCPASLRLNWKRELEAWIPADLGYVCVLSPEQLDKTKKCICIISYDSVWKHRIFPLLFRFPFELFVADESHYLKTEKAKRTRHTLALAQRSQHRIFLTGTPILNRPIELFPCLNSLRPDLFPDLMEFAERYCGLYLQEIWVAGEKTQMWNMDGATNLEELQKLLRSTVMIRRSKASVLPQLPKKFWQIIEFELSKKGEQALVHRENRLYDDLMSRRGVSVALTALSEGDSVQFEDFSKTRKEVAELKIPMAVEHITMMLESHKKVVVFAYHRNTIDRLTAELHAFHPVKFMGGMAEHLKQESVDRFQKDESCRVFIGNIKAAGVGITLTAASVVIFVEVDPVPGIMTQAEDRCVRIGAVADSVLIQYLVIEESLDVRICKMLLKKEQVADAALDQKCAFN